MKLQVFEINLKFFLLIDIKYEESYLKIAHFIDSALIKDSKLQELHNSNVYKNYTFNSFFPLENSEIYNKDKIYNVQIRTTNIELANYFCSILKNHYTEDMKALTTDIKIIPRKIISKIYSITPVIIKNNAFGYWMDNLSFLDYERRIRENLIKKYNNINKTQINEDFQLFDSIELVNSKPIGFNYKGKKILGDKVKIFISNNEMAQELAYMSLGTGVGEMNSRGAGYVNYKWL